MKKSSFCSKNKKEKKEDASQTSLSESSQSRSWSDPFGRSCTGDSFSFHKKTSSLERQQKILPDRLEAGERTLMEEIIKIWQEEVGELGIGTVTKTFLERLYKAFKTYFNQSLESWKAYCQMISSSKFLMGEAQNKFFKKAWITWAIKEETIDRIRGGEFRLGDRQTNIEKEIEHFNSELNYLELKKETIELQIERIKNIEKQKRETILKEKVQSLSDKETRVFEQEFSEFIESENNIMTEEFRKFKWSGMFISSYFNDFIKEKIAHELFERSLEEDQHNAIQSSGLLDLHEKVCKELTQFKQKKKDLESKIAWESKQAYSKLEASVSRNFTRSTKGLAFGTTR